MKMVSTLALAAALTLGMAATPAMAQKKKKDDAAAPATPTLKVSDAFRKPAGAAEAALKANDWAGAETNLAAAEAIAKSDDEKYYTAFMRMTIEIHKQNLPGIMAAADALIASPKTPADALPEYYFKRGQATFLAGRHADSIQYLVHSRELGFVNADTPVMLAQAYADANNDAASVTEMSHAIDAKKAAGQKAPEAWYNFAVAKTYKTGDRTATAAWMMRELAEYPTVTNWRKVFVIYRDSLDHGGTPLNNKQKIDLFRLMRFTGALADQNDYFDYGSFSLSAGLPWEAAAVIDEGKKAGKVPTGNADFGKITSSAQAAITSSGSLDKIAAQSKTGKELAGTGDAYLSSADYAKALATYDSALTKGGVDADEINLHRGIALVQLGRKDEARTAFGSVTKAPLSDIAKFWVVWIGMPPLTNA